MTLDENKTLIRRYFEEAFNSGNDALFDQFFTSDFKDHNAFEGQSPGPAGVRESYTMWRNAFPDSHGVIDDMIAEHDRVVVRTTLYATHHGTFMNIAPTHKRIEIRAISIFRIAKGKIVERWGLTEATKLKDILTGNTGPTS